MLCKNPYQNARHVVRGLVEKTKSSKAYMREAMLEKQGLNVGFCKHRAAVNTPYANWDNMYWEENAKNRMFST